MNEYNLLLWKEKYPMLNRTRLTMLPFTKYYREEQTGKLYLTPGPNRKVTQIEN